MSKINSSSKSKSNLIIPNLICKDLGQKPFQNIWDQMQDFTKNRDIDTPDEIWFLEHDPVYTLGQAGDPAHLLINPQNIPLVKTNRGGQITYHGPGQLIIYPLINLRRLKIGIKYLITSLEQMTLDLLDFYKIPNGHRSEQMPGIYINNSKLASIGLRVSRGCSLHGIAINIDMDLKPFTWINPCGQSGQKMVQLNQLASEFESKSESESVSMGAIKKWCENWWKNWFKNSQNIQPA